MIDAWPLVLVISGFLFAIVAGGMLWAIQIIGTPDPVFCPDCGTLLDRINSRYYECPACDMEWVRNDEGPTD